MKVATLASQATTARLPPVLLDNSSGPLTGGSDCVRVRFDGRRTMVVPGPKALDIASANSASFMTEMVVGGGTGGGDGPAGGV